MADTPLLCEIKIIAWNYPPKGWAFCNGQLLAINQNQALFSLLGTTYGGNGQTTFALPNLQGRVPIHAGNGFTLGQVGGEVTHTLLTSEMPSHTHVPQASSGSPNASTPANNFWAGNTGFAAYSGTHSETMLPGAISNTGGNQPHENESPYLVVNYCIALTGIFPTRN